MQSQHEGESAYLALASYILKYGQERSDERTGDDTISVFAPPSIRFDNVGERFPLLTTKRVFWRGVLEELLWFLRGSTDSKELEAKKVNIWRDNTTRKFLDDRGLHHLPEGDIGVGYGHQWRRWGARHPIDVELAARRECDGDDLLYRLSMLGVE